MPAGSALILFSPFRVDRRVKIDFDTYTISLCIWRVRTTRYLIPKILAPAWRLTPTLGRRHANVSG